MKLAYANCGVKIAASLLLAPAIGLLLPSPINMLCCNLSMFPLYAAVSFFFLPDRDATRTVALLSLSISILTASTANRF